MVGVVCEIIFYHLVVFARDGLNNYGSVFAVQAVFGVVEGGFDEHVNDIGIGESGDPL